MNRQIDRNLFNIVLCNFIDADKKYLTEEINTCMQIGI